VPDLLDALIRAIDAHGLPYMAAGPTASALHGAEEHTGALTLVVDATSEALDGLSAALRTELRLSVERGGDEITVVDPATGASASLSLVRDKPFPRVAFERREQLDTERGPVWAASREDSLLAELQLAEKAAEPCTVCPVLARMGIDRDYVRRWARVLGLESAWRRVRA
jgi:hypothetical protein